MKCFFVLFCFFDVVVGFFHTKLGANIRLKINPPIMTGDLFSISHLLPLADFSVQYDTPTHTHTPPRDAQQAIIPPCGFCEEPQTHLKLKT